jgi:hypothetical protein
MIEFREGFYPDGSDWHWMSTGDHRCRAEGVRRFPNAEDWDDSGGPTKSNQE